MVNAEKKIFLFGIKIFGSDPLQVLRLMDLSSHEGKLLQEKIIDGDYNWIYVDNTIILNHMKKWDDIIAMELNFKKCEHPLVEYIQKNIKNFNRLIEIFFHPNLPFAIISMEGGSVTKVLTWKNDDGEMHEIRIFNSIDSGQYDYRFSNDGKWVYFSEVMYGQNQNHFILMPVDPNLPHYLGNPIYLGEVPKYPDGVNAMTRNPAGLVVVDRTHYGGDFLLKKWDFTEAIPLIEKGK